MSARGTGSEYVTRSALATTAHFGWRTGTCTAEEWLHRNFRPQNRTVSTLKRTLEREIEIASPWRNRVVNTDGTFDLPHSFVIPVRELRICEVITHTCLPFAFSSACYPTISPSGQAQILFIFFLFFYSNDYSP